MPIQYYQGDIIETGADVLSVPVNCVGVAGAGLAKYIKGLFPFEMGIYSQQARLGNIKPGKVLFVECIENNKYVFNPPKYLVMFPTKRHYSRPSDYELIERGIQNLKFHARYYKIKTIALPKLGCGLGKLDWNEVKFILEFELSDEQLVYLLPK